MAPLVSAGRPRRAGRAPRHRTENMSSTERYTNFHMMRTDFEPVACCRESRLVDPGKENIVANDLEWPHRLVEGQSDKASQGHRWHTAPHRYSISEGHRHPLSVRALSRFAPAMQDLRPAIDMMVTCGKAPCHSAPGPSRFIRHGQEPLAVSAGHPDRGRGGIARVLRIAVVVRTICAQGHAEERHCQA